MKLPVFAHTSEQIAFPPTSTAKTAGRCAYKSQPGHLHGCTVISHAVRLQFLGVFLRVVPKDALICRVR